ncbi:hypothetical protein [Zobellia sp. B3R18]|uniref:hypothetical protein n=1 Tax=Zobellia sp. B3R18 TaxID=2841568 RepID=UPI001C06C9E4|nr:hypothetical protein [Zobellia sp. B3R18]MBU2973140.1 hypothetical protein [Zobellia sp. B3R18]
MKNTFKVLLLSLISTTAVHSIKSNEVMDENHLELSENFNSIRCGFLEIKSPFRTDKIVRATRAGCFRWEYSKNGKVTSVSETITIKQGESKRGFSKNGETVKIRCSCRNQRRSVQPNH